MPSIKGTASVSDARARSKALKSTRFPKNFSKKVNLEKVNKPVLTQWIEQKVTSILGFDDEIVSSTAINLFLPSEGDGPDPRRAQLDLVGFLGEEESASFAKEVWNLMLEAESSNSGIPITLLEKKKKELSQKTAAMNAPASHPSGRPSQHDNSVVQRNRNPEMNRFVQEAARRAQAARQMVGAPHDVPPGARDAAPVPVPVSPPHSSEKEQNKSSSSNSDRKMPPRERQRHYRSDMHRPYSYRDAPPFRDGGGGYPPPRGYDDRARRPYPGRMDRSRSRSMDRGRRRDDDRRWDDRRRGSRESDRRWQYDEDREFEVLERRLNVLKKQLSNRGDNYALDDEYEDVKDRLYELERRRWRHRREREQEEYRGRTHRRHDDSPRRGRSPDSPRRRRGSRSPESDHRSRRSGSPGAGGRRGRRRSEGSDRRRSRGKSSDSESSRSSSSSGSGHRRRRSPSYDRRRDRSRKERDDRRRRSRSHSKSSYSSSGSSRSSHSSDNDNGPH